MRTFHRLSLVSLAGLAVAGVALTAVVLPTTAGAQTAGAVEPASSLILTVTPETPSDDNPLSSVTLECDPTGGDHPAAEGACKTVTEFDGDFEKLASNPVGCTAAQYDPVTITATGNWGEREVDFKAWFTNRDCAAAATHEVYAF